MSEQKQNANGVAYHLEPRRGLTGLTTAVQQIPEPGPGQVVVRVRATALNRRDIMLMDGSYVLPATPGVVPLVDGVGDVIAVGSGVTRAAIGDRVAGTYFVAWNDGPQLQATSAQQYGANHDGWLATYALLEEDSVVHVPAYLSDAEAASLACAGLVAWAALTKPIPAGPGETVLTTGTGTVALAAIQHAKMLGARVISITSSAEKAERLRKLGADEVIDRVEVPDWERVVLELTGGEGVQHAVEAVGMPTLPKSVAAAAYNAQVTLIGAFPPAPGQPQPPSLFGGKFVSIRRIAVGSRADFEAMNAALTAHQVRPVIDRVYPFEQSIEAYRYFMEGDPFGKVVITMD
ncbi:zinc-dependent alcohol dehydrogenase family protein [Nocardia tengchongensis]|uniref:zinc-dependent alcohol dehydrogenase family protein n=1 Tax=Nocardia tengchongensis TaxID=2055889 RepID=UPI00360F1A20